MRKLALDDEILLKKSLISVKVNPNKLKINLNY